jgi:S-adenosylmethionine:tRNA ribosyltransferase-isomerase
LIGQAQSKNRRVVAIGTTVVRALESAATPDGSVRAGAGVASGRVIRETRLQVVDSQVSTALKKHCYRTHEFGDLMLIERQFSR